LHFNIKCSRSFVPVLHSWQVSLTLCWLYFARFDCRV
jgi:hypothetical protein